MPPKKPEPSLSSYAQVIKATEVRRSVPKKRDIPPLPSPEKKILEFFWIFFFNDRPCRLFAAKACCSVLKMCFQSNDTSGIFWKCVF